MKKSSKLSGNQALPIFFTFLQQNGALDSFLKNLFQSDCPFNASRLLDIDPDRYLDSTFFWHDTPEGLDYWFKLNHRWRLIVGLF